jgi:DNA-binding response OmpR family regulator
LARVLVIDDEPDVLIVCRMNLEHAGHEVHVAESAEIGLAIAREVRPDIVVLDVMMPVRDGFDVLVTLLAEQPSLPVLFLTVKAFAEDRIRAWEAGAADYIIKPFSPAALTDAVARALEESPDQREQRRRAALETLLRSLASYST